MHASRTAGVVYFIKMQAERSTPAGVINLSDVSRPARGHVALLGAFLLALWAWGLYLSRFGQMHLAAGLFTGPGFADINVQTIPLVWKGSSGRECLDLIYNSTVRTAMLLEHQAPEALERTHHAFIDGAEKFRKGGAIEMAWPAILASATKP